LNVFLFGWALTMTLLAGLAIGAWVGELRHSRTLSQVALRGVPGKGVRRAKTARVQEDEEVAMLEVKARVSDRLAAHIQREGHGEKRAREEAERMVNSFETWGQQPQ